jgi:hypothetical protein
LNLKKTTETNEEKCEIRDKNKKVKFYFCKLTTNKLVCAEIKAKTAPMEENNNFLRQEFP